VVENTGQPSVFAAKNVDAGGMAQIKRLFIF
jgi:hypothetical protein